MFVTHCCYVYVYTCMCCIFESKLVISTTCAVPHFLINSPFVSTLRPKTMGKDGGTMTAKAIAKKIKASGLGRLRWYCQMCEKQCRDENGFQMHISSESHKRLLAVFAESPNEFIGGFSDKFRRDFLQVVKQRFGTTFVLANNAYQEYIKDRHHLHMNATRWTTLRGFVEELGRTSYAIVEVRETGYWLKLIDREAAARADVARADDRKRAEDLHRADARLEAQIQAAADISTKNVTQDNSAILDTENAVTSFEEPVELRMREVNFSSRKQNDGSKPSSSNVFGETDNENGRKKRRRKSRWGVAPKKTTALDEIVAANARTQPSKPADMLPKVSPSSNIFEGDLEEAVKNGRDDDEEIAWVMKGIEVQITNKTVGNGQFYGKKGIVFDVIEEFGAKVRVCGTGVELQLDQDDLETVIPGSEASVVILRGEFKSRRAVITKWNEERKMAIIKLEGSGEIRKCKYKHICKI